MSDMPQYHPHFETYQQRDYRQFVEEIELYMRRSIPKKITTSRILPDFSGYTRVPVHVSQSS